MNHINNLADMSQCVLELVGSDGYVPMDMRDMTAVLTLEVEQYDLFAEAVETLKRAGEITETKRGRIIKVEGSDRVNGKYRATTRGFGFVTPDSHDGKTQPDIYIPRERSLGAMNGDRVQVKRAASHGDSPEGEVVLIIERAISEVVGTFRELHERVKLPKKTKKKFPRPTEQVRYIVKPDDAKLTFRVKIPPSMRNNAKDGEKVLVGITKYPQPPLPGKLSGESEALGKVLRVFGERDSKSANYQSILYANGVRTHFPDEVSAEARKIAECEILPDGRLDLRDKLIFTIDGADAKDFDDAISLERDGDGYLLGVHIADVSHYVKPGSALDNEAFERGTSIYFTDKVVPMLPEELSNGVCSLNRDTDKYTLSALIRLDADAEIREVTLHEAIISSKLRGVYSEVNDVIDRREESEYWEKYSFLFPDTLPMMVELYEKFKQKSDARGALELETVEAGFVLDADGMPVDIVRRERGVAEKLIEQFMLCANRAVAEWLNSLGMPCVYRTHEEPSSEKVQAFAMFSHNLGLNITPLRRRKLLPSAYCEVYDEAREKGLDSILTVVMLRSLMKAKYTVSPAPHFGLGCELYCHFTSPIRRYPDLAVHRIVRAVLHGDINVDALTDFADRAAVKSSENELRAMNAERDIEDLYKVLFMSDKVGKVFDGIVSSVTSFGMFVELENTCEGLVPIASMDGYFEYNQQNLTLSCGKVVYQLGDRVRVKLVGCDLVTRKIDFKLI
ncbi:MAG: ribonuclease R [Clostridiales bacterium]|nr:ribonuclease R [Clostridiales bacterium]